MSYYLGALLGGSTHILGGQPGTPPLACGTASKVSRYKFNRRNDAFYPTLELALQAARKVHRACRSCVGSAERALGVAQPKAVRRRPMAPGLSREHARAEQIVKVERMEVNARSLTAFAFNGGVTLELADQLLLAATELPFRRMPCTSPECQDVRVDHVVLRGAHGGRDLLYCTECGQVDLWL